MVRVIVDIEEEKAVAEGDRPRVTCKVYKETSAASGEAEEMAADGLLADVQMRLGIAKENSRCLKWEDREVEVNNQKPDIEQETFGF